MAAYYGPFPVAGIRGNAKGLYDSVVNWDAVPVPKSAITEIYIEEVEVYTQGEIAAMFLFAPLGVIVEWMQQHALLWFVKALVCKDGQPQFIDLPIRGNWNVSGPSTHIKERVTRRVLRYTLDQFKDGFPAVGRREGIPIVSVGSFAPPVGSAADAVAKGRSTSPCTGTGQKPICLVNPQHPSCRPATGGGTPPPTGTEGPPGRNGRPTGTEWLTTGPLADDRIRAAMVLTMLLAAYMLWKS